MSNYFGNQHLDTDYPQHPGGYHERQGLAVSSPTDYSNPSKVYVPNSKWTWAFLSITTSQAIIGLALEGYIFGRFEHALASTAGSFPQSRTVPAELSLFIFGFIYQLILVWDALRLKNTIQVIGLCLYNVGLLVEAGVQYDQIGDAVRGLIEVPANQGGRQIDSSVQDGVRPYTIAVPCVIALGTVLMSFVAWKLNEEFAWTIYKKISADPKLRKMYLAYQVYIALLKFDFFFFLAFTVQFLVVVSSTPRYELGITVAAIPLTVVMLFLAAIWTRTENLWGTVCTLVLYFAGLAYFIFKLVRMYNGPPGRVEEYAPARKTLTTFAVLTILLLITTIVYACICASNFKKGLKKQIHSEGYFHCWGRRRRAHSEDRLCPDGGAPLASPGPRIEID